MNMKNHKTNIILIAGISALVLTALFLVVKVTALFVVAYALALAGIALACLGWLELLGNLKSYPWVVALPKTIQRYCFAQLLLSAGFVILDQFKIFTLPWQWFLLLHVMLAAVFAMTLIMLKSGKDIIENRGDEVKAKVATLRFMQTDVESLMRKFPQHGKDLKPVADALRYSDPMSHASLAVVEEQIQRGIMAMNDGTDITGRCAELLRQIADRNGRAKILK